jgi:hypothetical protein
MGGCRNSDIDGTFEMTLRILRRLRGREVERMSGCRNVYVDRDGRARERGVESTGWRTGLEYAGVATCD